VEHTDYQKGYVGKLVTDWCDADRVKSSGHGQKRRIEPEAIDTIAGFLLSKDVAKAETEDNDPDFLR
jgi:hypothetical protein